MKYFISMPQAKALGAWGLATPLTLCVPFLLFWLNIELTFHAKMAFMHL
jgi:hypothetical protein